MCGPSIVDLQRVAQFGGAADMVDMAMGQPDLFDGHVGLLDRRLNLRNVAAGVDHHGLSGGFAPYQRAVLLEQRYRNDERRRLSPWSRFPVSWPHNADFWRLAKEKIWREFGLFTPKWAGGR